ncbi:phage tail protein [Streptacidiphilus sp. PB12-B1b]|uniref:phage tail protein n=1 Tax=Streptacidiphilus sp. PB12-B1b TaxID=2705012 RepID=UPI0015FA472D|nr:phage tail protein [Streptacidiphilus sp. PB12-B1b]QMU78007.1 phage tail protein [Streptacidiphilus sp. PB12-B1b]
MSISSFAPAGGQGGGQLGLALAPLGGTAASTAVSAARASAADSAFRYFGLSMRFTVRFSSNGGIDWLGEWSSCKGLRVDFRTEAVRIGGEYGNEVKLPVQVAYAPIVLERAMERQSSQALQAWLGKLVTTWMHSDDAGARPPEGTVDIELQDVHQNVVAGWSLRNAYPVAWSGPVMDAKQNAVAIETLTLEHEGFLPGPAAAGV